MADIIEKVEQIDKNVQYIVHMLEGNELSPGLIETVKSNTRDIAELEQTAVKRHWDGNTLISIAWMCLVLSAILSVADRALLISDVRHLLPITTSQALASTIVLGYTAKMMVAISAAIFVGKLARGWA